MKNPSLEPSGSKVGWFFLLTSRFVSRFFVFFSLPFVRGA